MALSQDVYKCLDRYFEQYVQALNQPGLAIGITDHQCLLFEGFYGLANRDTRTPVTSDALFQIGSISKSFTSIVLLQLEQQGLLCLDDPVTNYLPWFAVQSEYAPITLRHLMSHTAGIITGNDDTLAAVTETWNLRYTRASAPPGEMFHYSNSGYKVLGLVLEEVLGQCLGDILDQRILAPLGMSETIPVITNGARPRMAVGYAPYFDDRPHRRGGPLAPATWLESDTADGSICSTAEDMSRYMRSLLDHGKGLLTTEGFKRLIQPHIPTSDDLHGEYYCLGLSICRIKGHTIIGHSGGMVGYTADMLIDLDEGLGVIVLNNGPLEPEEITRHILNILRSDQFGDDLSQLAVYKPLKAKQVNVYAGTYRCGDKVVKFTPENEQLALEFEGESILLEPIGPDVYLASHPTFELFPLRFRRNRSHPPNPAHKNEDADPIFDIVHGADIYHCQENISSVVPNYPSEWNAYSGHYRSHNPWYSNFRVVVRRGELILIDPFGEEQVLHASGSGFFRIGDNPLSPEFIHFDSINAGKAMRSNLSGGIYSRTFTP